MKYYTKIVPSDMVIKYETYTIPEILDEYFPSWAEAMIEGGQGNFVDEESCIRDWVLLHDAWESDSEGHHVLPSSASGASA